MTHQQSESLVKWLADASARILYGEVTITVKLHAGEVRRIEKAAMEAVKPDEELTKELHSATKRNSLNVWVNKIPTRHDDRQQKVERVFE